MAVVDIEENLIPVHFVELLVRASRANQSEQLLTKLSEWIRSKHVDSKCRFLFASTENVRYNPENIHVPYKVFHSVSMTYIDSLKPLLNAVCHTLTETDDSIPNDMLPEFEKMPSKLRIQNI